MSVHLSTENPAGTANDRAAGNLPLSEVLDQHTIRGELCHPENGRIRCIACGHRCLIGPGRRGICKVRFNRDGELRVPFGYVAGLQCDPVEKKPFFHVYPGSDALTFGMLGCDFHCSYCQNWVTSQALRDDAAVANIKRVTPGEIAGIALRFGAKLVVSSYNEPLITSEWAVAVFREARAAGLQCACVSNGNLTPEVLEYIRPWIIACKIDLKSFNDRSYRTLGGTLAAVTEGIRLVHRSGLWLEVVTLLVPGLNDSEPELRAMAQFLVSVSPDIPWHVTAFHPDYKMPGTAATTTDQLRLAAKIGREAGLRFVYAGNAPGRVGDLENTVCPACGRTVVVRRGYVISNVDVTHAGQCGHCGTRIPGLWNPSVREVPAGMRRYS